MGNASSLVKSEDWAALIADAKARKCYMDMDSLPTDFLAGPKAAPPPPPPPYGPPPPKFSKTRGSMKPEFRRRPPLGYEDKTNSSSTSREPSYKPFEPPLGYEDKTNSSSTSREATYSPFEPPLEDSMDDFDRSRVSWQYSRQNSNGVLGKRDP